MKSAIFSGSCEYVFSRDIQEFLDSNPNIDINSKFSFRCPVCFFPVSFVHESEDRIPYFKHNSSNLNQNCPLYTGDGVISQERADELLSNQRGFGLRGGMRGFGGDFHGKRGGFQGRGFAPGASPDNTAIPSFFSF